MAKKADQTELEADQGQITVDSTIKPWTIKNVPPEARNAAITAAERTGQPIGTWLASAIRVALKTEREGSRALVTAKRREPRPALDIASVERSVSAIAQLAAATGAPPPPEVSRAAYAALRRSLTVVPSGSPPLTSEPSPVSAGLPHAPSGQTAETSGQTVD